MKLPPLNEVDEDLDLGFSEKVDVTPKHCKHELYLVSASEARCKHCTAGWQGYGMTKLVEAVNKANKHQT